MPILLAFLVGSGAWTIKTVMDLQIAVADLKSAVTHVMHKINETYQPWK